MAVRKLSVSLDEDAAAAAETAAYAEGLSLSAWLSRAALRETMLERGLRAVTDYEAEHGGFSPEELAEADAILDGLGVGRPEPAARRAALARLTDGPRSQ